MYATCSRPAVTCSPQLAPSPSSGWGNGAELAALPTMGAQHASDDHLDLGGSHFVSLPAKDGEHHLTSGDLNALADYVASPEALAELTVAELLRGLELMAREPLSPEDSEELMGIFPAYQELSFANGNHFGASDPAICEPSGGGGATNRSEIAGWLADAFACAAEAGRSADAVSLDAAISKAAFGGHFVADAFSSGHLFHKGDMMAAIAGGVAAAGADGMAGLVAMASARIASEGREVLDGWRAVGGPLGLRPVTSGDLMALMTAVLVARPEVFHNGVVLAVHNQLSVEGVDVTDGCVTWRMFGDGNLDAVSAARCEMLIDDIYAAVLAAYTRPDDVPSVDSFLARLPVPVGDESARIHELIERSSTVAGGGMEDAVVAGSLAQLDTILSQASLFGLIPFTRVGSGAPAHDPHGGSDSDHPDAHDFSDVVGPWTSPPALPA